MQRIAPDADFRRKMPCEARQAGSVLKPGDEKAHGRVAEPIPDGQQPLAHEGGGIVPVPGEALRADAQDDSRGRGQPTAYGLVVEESRSRDMASFVISAPGVRAKKPEFIGFSDSPDRGITVQAGDEITYVLTDIAEQTRRRWRRCATMAGIITGSTAPG